MRYVLDTSALLAHYRQENGGQAVQTLFEADEAELIVASVSLTEFGRRLRELGAGEGEVEAVLTSYQLLFNEVAAVDAAIPHELNRHPCTRPHPVSCAPDRVRSAACCRGMKAPPLDT